MHTRAPVRLDGHLAAHGNVRGRLERLGQRLNVDGNIGELSGTARLLLMAVGGAGARLDRLPVGHFWFDELHLYTETVLEPEAGDLQVHLTLAGEHNLAQEWILNDFQRRILFDKLVQPLHHLVFVALAKRAHGHRITRLGKFDGRQHEGRTLGPERIVRVRVAQLDRGTQIAGHHTRHGLSFAAVHGVERAQPLHGAGLGVFQVHALLQRARVDAEVGEITHVLLGHRAEDEGHRRPRRIRCQRAAIHQLRGRHVGGRGRHVHQKAQQPGDADYLGGAHHEDRKELPADHGRPEPFTHLVFGERAFFEVQLHQALIVFRNIFDEGRVELLRFLAEGRIDLIFLRFQAAFRVGELLHVQHVDDRARARPGRNLHHRGPASEPLLDLRHQRAEVGFGPIQVVDHEHRRDLLLEAVFPGQLRAHLDALDRIHHIDGQVCHPKCGQHLPDEVRIARRVEHVDFMVLPGHMQQRREDRHATFLLAGVVVADRVALFDRAHARNDAGRVEHGFGQHRFAAPLVSDQRNVTNVRGFVDLHRHLLLVWNRAEAFL